MSETNGTEARPSLLERQSRGGDIGEGGINFQAEVVLSYIPKWLSIEGFTSMLREGMVDTEAMFFVPGRGYINEAVEVKDHQVLPSEFWKEFKRFKELETAEPGKYQWFTFASAGLSQDLRPIVNSLRRIRDPYDFYEGSAVMDNSYDEYLRIVKDAGRSEEDADFLFRRVLIDGDLSTARDHGFALFQHSLQEHLCQYRDLPGSVIRDIYSDLATFVKSRKNQPIFRSELERILRNRIPERSLPPFEPVRLHTASNDLVSESDRTALRFEWAQFFEPGPEGYPPPELWNNRLLGELRETKDWILKHRETRRIALTGNRRLSASLAIGSVFAAVAGFSVEMTYREGATWATDAHADSDSPVYPLTPDELPHLMKGARLAVSVSIIRDIAPEVESSLRRSGLGNVPMLHIRGDQPISSPQQANLAVREIKKLISDALSITGARQVDLFFAGPAFLALFLGHRLNATAPIQCYEKLSTGLYVPTCLLFGREELPKDSCLPVDAYSVDDLTEEEKEIRDLFDEACRLKDVARKSVDDIDMYLQAAERLHQAVALSTTLAERESTNLDEKIQHMVFGLYYSYEEHYCLGGYYYEKRDTQNSIKHHKISGEHLRQAIALIGNPPLYLSSKTREYLISFLPNWQHFQRYVEIKILANQARAAWDDERYIDALDIYRIMAARQREFISSPEFEDIAPQHQRIALANFIGTMANASSAMAGVVLGRAERVDSDGAREIPFDLLIKLVKYTLDAYRFGNAAFDQNPEWDQYRIIARHCFANIQQFLEDNPSARKPLSIAFDGDTDFIKILKTIDSETSSQKANKVKILLLSANPTGTTALKIDEEMRAITQKVRAAEHRDLIQIVTASAIRPDDLLQAMNEHRPHVVQFSGHGSENDEIIVCDDIGNPKPVSKEALIALFESTRSNVRVVVLNSCYSKSQAEAIVSVVPCAIGMKDSIGDRSALIFAASFYRAIAFGHSVETAFKQGIAALKLEGIDQDEIPELITHGDVDPSGVFVVNF